ncbi:LINE-1 type transposase domain-containing 1 [Pelobates cultripes]|uniref:LINE-1 type transposase domain-containing 1 n=1 Tax=Pelobates cultripes TaxID=61616 RepID=A0AAD1TK26_PELCU|nr:LINE-1 type transposase domain-containing 1 [Pelobates cultripes]
MEEDIVFQLQAVKDTQIKTELKLKEMEDKMCELEDRSRRLNLRFRNIPEDILDAQLYDFLIKYFNCLGVLTAQQDIKLSQYHRLSYRKEDQLYPRDVIVAFVSYDLRTQILQSARKTKINDEKFTALKVLTDVSYLTRQRRNLFSTVFRV